MKKVLLGFLFTFVALLAINTSLNVQADGEIELYPYDKIECLNAEDSCTNYKVGDSHWSLNYNGYRYHFVNGAARYVSDWSDDNSDDYLDATEITAISWGSFGHVMHNNTASEVTLVTANGRTDLSGNVVNRIYVYFDENGKAQMWEDHYVNKYDVQNDAGTWRFATAAEVTAVTDATATLEAAQTAEAAVVANEASTAQELADAAAVTLAAQTAKDTLTADTKLNVPIRLRLDAVDTRGYVLEPFVQLTWRELGTASDDPIEDQSGMIAGDPNNIVIPAGWTVVGFSSLDRDNTNTKTVDFIASIVPTMTGEVVAADAVFEWDEQPAWFSGLSALDDDGASAGIQAVVDFNGEFSLADTITATWTNMFDDTTQAIMPSDEMIDYSVTISLDGTDLETIDYVLTEGVYVASAAVTAVDTSAFGNLYKATYSATTPEGVVKESVIDIVVGVIPPYFMGVEDFYTNENEMVDLLADITADNGYGMDITDLIDISFPAGFNPYNPTPGTYEIELEFTYNVFIPGLPSSPDFTVDGTPETWSQIVNPPQAINANGGAFMIYTDAAVFAAAGSGWGSVMVLVGSDGLVDEIYDRYDWSHTTSTGTVTGDATAFAAWQAAVVIEEGGFVIAAHGSTHGGGLRDTVITYDDPIIVDFGTPDIDEDLYKSTSYMLTVDDLTAPVALIVDEAYAIEIGEFANVDKAILANVVAFDANDSMDDIAMYVSDNGGLLLDTVGTYTVEVTVEDVTGNATMVEFDVMVMAPEVTTADVQALLDAQTITAEEIQALLDAQTITLAEAQALLDDQTINNAEIQALIDAAIVANQADLDASGCGSAVNGASSIFMIMGSVALMGGAITFFLKRR